MKVGSTGHSWGRHLFGASLAAALALGAPQAGAVVIDFESLMHVDADIADHGISYSEDGFTVSQLGDLATFGTLAPQFSGSTAMFNNTIGGVTELARTGGGSFSLTSIALAELNGPNVANVTFVGDLTGGGTVTNTFTLDGVAFGAQTFAFTGFGSVSKVSWGQVFPYHQFDNINVDGVLNGVPEPASLALLGLGLAGLVLMRRRKTA